MERWTYEKLAEAWDALTVHNANLRDQLGRLCNFNSPLDRQIRIEFDNELRDEWVEACATLFAHAGWTEAEFDAEIARRVHEKSE